MKEFQPLVVLDVELESFSLSFSRREADEEVFQGGEGRKGRGDLRDGRKLPIWLRTRNSKQDHCIQLVVTY